MNYWLTVHWPRRVDERPNLRWRNWVFLAEGWEATGRDVEPGDRVFVYETETAPRVKEGKRFVARLPGRKGVVALASVKTRRQYGPHTVPEELEEGRVRCWSYHFQTRTERETLLSLEELRNALRKPGFSARIPGGLMRLGEDRFNRILERFNRAT